MVPNLQRSSAVFKLRLVWFCCPLPPTLSLYSSRTRQYDGPATNECVSDTPTIFPKRQLSFYAILLCIVGPVSLLSLTKWELILFIYCAVETLFCIYHTLVARNLRKKSSVLPQYELHHLRNLFTRILQTGLAPPTPTLTMISRTMPQAHGPAAEAAHLRAGSKLRPAAEIESSASSSQLVSPLRLTLDPLDITGRPAAFYALTGFANFVYRSYLKRTFGVVHGKFGKLEYFLRQPEVTTNEAKEPIVFMHGLGIGPAQYSMFISQILREFPNRPVLVPLQPHISQAIFHPGHLDALNKTELVDTLRGLLEELGWAQSDDKPSSSRVTFISHSNGSVPHAWMLKAYPQLLQRNCFVDPVTFCLWEGDVCYNFVYKRPVNGLDVLMRYFVGTELGIANHIQRQFDWSANSLWFEEIPGARDPKRSMFFIGGKDSIIDGERVRRYLRSHGIRKGVRFDPEGRHGSALVAGSEGLKGVIDWLGGLQGKN
ncbi:hypothetical protein RhiXN_04518 [Rhizoctonia solani]|uniref:AB hydrolase-1 domain-containing protein n=1 Tax=Rhizoctonia solani TaxID=456999 RepID=A0A8H8NQM8_9AGAM|nr:uncharacterized protein RhiXN_04518 [Rhizoctonia solani]QRW16517.1 hypothetical protein RhiXN_04518 [Rhizoctonia solani]